MLSRQRGAQTRSIAILIHKKKFAYESHAGVQLILETVQAEGINHGVFLGADLAQARRQGSMNPDLGMVIKRTLIGRRALSELHPDSICIMGLLNSHGSNPMKHLVVCQFS